MLLQSLSSGLVWLPGRPPPPASVPLPTLACSLFLSETGVYSRLGMEVWRRSHHLLRHTSEGFGFHVALEEQRKHLLWRRGPASSMCTCVCVIVTGAGCVPMSDRVCYLCRLRHSYNRGHGILSSSWNTNLEPDLWPWGVALCLTALWALLSFGLMLSEVTVKL